MVLLSQVLLAAEGGIWDTVTLTALSYQDYLHLFTGIKKESFDDRKQLFHRWRPFPMITRNKSGGCACKCKLGENEQIIKDLRKLNNLSTVQSASEMTDADLSTKHWKKAINNIIIIKVTITSKVIYNDLNTCCINMIDCVGYHKTNYKSKCRKQLFTHTKMCLFQGPFKKTYLPPY